MSQLFQKTLKQAVDKDYLGFSESLGEILESKFAEKLTEKISDVRDSIFEKDEYDESGDEEEEVTDDDDY